VRERPEENRVYVCSCFGVTDRQVREHQEAGACTPRDIASVSKAGTDCGSCVRRIQGLLGRGGCPRRQLQTSSAEEPVTAEAVGEAA
jgi:bacterioferritin-associated ferredoxin